MNQHRFELSHRRPVFTQLFQLCSFFCVGWCWAAGNAFAESSFSRDEACCSSANDFPAYCLDKARLWIYEY